MATRRRRRLAHTVFGSGINSVVLCVCWLGGVTPCAAQLGDELLLVLPDVDQPPSPPTLQMLTAWCEETGLAAWRGVRVGGASAPLRCVGGASIERPPVRALDALFTRLLTPDERTALVQGRVLMLDRVSSPAREVRGPAYQHAPTQYPGLGEPAAEGQRRAQWNTAWRHQHGREMTDEEWAAIWASEQHERGIVERFGALRFRPGVRCGLALSARLVTADGLPLTGKTVVYSTMAPPDSDLFTAWDDISLVATGKAVPMPTPGHPAVAWIEEHQPKTPTVVFVTSGVRTLAELTALLSAWEPCGVDTALAHDRLYVSAGEYHAADLKHAVQLASGLVFRAVDDGDGHRLVLGPYPDVVLSATQTAPDTALWAEMAPTEAAEDWILERFFSTADGIADRRVEWAELSTDEREWILARAGVATPIAGGTQVHPGRLDDAAAARSVVELSLREVWERGFYSEVQDELGRIIYWRAFAVRVNRRPAPG